VAVGTSLPELATSVLAAARREVDLALGNVVGSNLFNILGVLGASALVAPVPAPAAMLRLEVLVILALGLVLLPLARPRPPIGRGGGAALLLAYVAFAFALVVRALQ
jgi:cation:H+ antiporter